MRWTGHEGHQLGKPGYCRLTEPNARRDTLDTPSIGNGTMSIKLVLLAPLCFRFEIRLDFDLSAFFPAPSALPYVLA